MTDKKTGVVLLVHGSKDPSWMKPFEELRDEVSQRSPGARVELACLQFCAPALEDTIGELCGEGIKRVMVVPVFISSLGHVTKDVPAMVEAARAKYPELKIELGNALGEMPQVKAAFRDALIRLAGLELDKE